MELDLTKETFSVKAGGQKFEIRYATRKEIQEVKGFLNKDLKEESLALDEVRDFLVKKGLPEGMFEEIPFRHVLRIFKAVIDPN